MKFPFRRVMTAAAMVLLASVAMAGERFNFNAGWLVKIGPDAAASGLSAADTRWQQVTLPWSFNQTEAFARPIHQLTDTVCWYRKHFRLTGRLQQARKVFVEFEGVRFGARVWLNGHELGWGENGVMAFGFDLTPYLHRDGDNVLAVLVDNSWRYHEQAPGTPHSTFQWNDKNFFCNYGGINKNVWLHAMYSDVYQTLPLYSNLQTTGVYVYAADYDIPARTATVHARSEVRNDGTGPLAVGYQVEVLDAGGNSIALFDGETVTVLPGQTACCEAARRIEGLHFWSWGYGYLYTVKTRLLAGGQCIDEATTRTGFRKTEFRDGMVLLNDRVLHLKGFAQRSTNEWPAVGISIPAWMSDYSNRLVLGCNGNLVRWMHVTPMKQDVLSFDRLGLLQAMPAGDAEKDADGRRWQQRTEVMRDAIIYNRNNPSVVFYECGNNQIGEQHMAEMKQLRNLYDPCGGRAIGSRNMLDSREAEYGGEMLYVNKSAAKPMWQMEYCRDEGVRRYWDQWSYPFHKEGEGPLFRGERAVSYNHNQDGLAVENVVRWNEYWLARPGQGRRVNSGGAKIIFSDSNTHFRGEKNYRTSGDVDAMRIAKDSYFTHQAMWDGWVDTEREHTYIVGHWNYDEQVEKPVYVVSTADSVELLLGGRSLGKGQRSETFLFTFPYVRWQAGTLTAIGYKEGREVSRHALETAGAPAALRVHWIEAPEMFRADGADIRMAEIEVVDREGRRCPLAHDMLTFSLKGQGEWLGGLSGLTEDSLDNRVLSRELPVEAGVCRVMVRSTTKAGKLQLTVSGKGFKKATLSAQTTATPVRDGFYVDAGGQPIAADWQSELPLCLERGETPLTPSFRQEYTTVDISHVDAAVRKQDTANLYDDNEATRWTSDGPLDHAWLTFHLQRPAAVRQICLRMHDFRKASYPLQITAADGTVLWTGYTPKSLGYVYLNVANPVVSDAYTIRLLGPAVVKEGFADITELAARQRVSRSSSTTGRLSIIEAEFKE